MEYWKVNAEKQSILLDLNSIGLLYDFAGYQTKQSLVYDLQEPFRWICEIASLEAFESDLLDLKNFYFLGDDYRYHIDFEAKHRFLELLKERFNSGVKYKGKHWKWDTVILKKTEKLGLMDLTVLIESNNKIQEVPIFPEYWDQYVKLKSWANINGGIFTN